jgi:metal-dependent HD superfamily phosphatase/phosphodiesterase
MVHYADSIDFTSPFIIELTNDPNGRISNKNDLKDYFSRALNQFPELHFELLNSFLSVNSLVIHYKSVNNMMAAEYFEFNDHGKITRVIAHYSNNA